MAQAIHGKFVGICSMEEFLSLFSPDISRDTYISALNANKANDRLKILTVFLELRTLTACEMVTHHNL